MKLINWPIWNRIKKWVKKWIVATKKDWTLIVIEERNRIVF